LGELSAVFTRRPASFGYGVKGIILIGIAVMALVTSVGSASAQGIFEALFGRRWNSAPTAYADPFSQFNPFGARSPEAPRPDTSGSVAYCVRLCDGRYFPIQRHGGASPAQACSSFCPASATKIYNGDNIDQAVAPDGKRYAELGTAFAYRDKIVPGCTCNGKDAFGLVNTPVADDSTLRPGDIVATNGGLMAYNGGGKQPDFTPIEAYSGLSAELRRQLTETKIMPATEQPAAPKPTRQAEPAGRNGKNKRAQLDR
jgi:hypothetical protein